MQTINPYQPPGSTSPERELSASPRFLVSLVQAMLVVGVTLVIWVALIWTFERRIPTPLLMFVWSSTLFLSSSLSTVAVVRVWPKATHPFAFLVAFALFSIVFLVAEGDTSRGTDYLQTAILYGTLAALPVTLFFLARYLAFKLR